MKSISVTYSNAEWRIIVKQKNKAKKELKLPNLSWHDFLLIAAEEYNGK